MRLAAALIALWALAPFGATGGSSAVHEEQCPSVASHARSWLLITSADCDGPATSAPSQQPVLRSRPKAAARVLDGPHLPATASVEATGCATRLAKATLAVPWLAEVPATDRCIVFGRLLL